jgi:probable addiction module antidote protein
MPTSNTKKTTKRAASKIPKTASYKAKKKAVKPAVITASAPYKPTQHEWLREDAKHAATFLEAAIEAGNPGDIMAALRDIAEAHGGVTEIAKATCISRETLNRTLSKKGNPQLLSLMPILEAVGLRLVVAPVKKGGLMKANKPETGYEIAEIDDNFYKWLHDQAKDGDRSSALHMLSTFVAKANVQMEIPRPIIEYFMYAFNDYLSDKSEGDKDALALRKHLLLAPPTGRRKGSVGKKHQKVVAVSRYWLYQKRDGMSATDAKKKVAHELGVSVKTVEADNTEYNAIRDWSLKELEENSHLASESLLKK